MCSYIKSYDATSLRQLILNGNEGIGDQGGDRICIALTESQNCKLEYLDLSETGIGGMNSMRALGEYLISPSSSHLNTLYLGGNKKIGEIEEGMQLLCSALSLNSTLSSLYLWSCGIRDRGASTLQSLLSINSTLSFINLGGFNEISPQLKRQVEGLANSKRFDVITKGH